MKKVRFRVISYSSEDPEFPANQLNDNVSARTRGWRSARHCEYPQRMVIEMIDGPVNISQVQVLSHQSKIATKIELFVGNSSSTEKEETAAGNSEIGTQFKRLGYFSLEDGRRTNYKSRELKTVSITDVYGLYVKLVIHESFINDKNPYNQVGIMAVTILTPISKQETSFPVLSDLLGVSASTHSNNDNNYSEEQDTEHRRHHHQQQEQERAGGKHRERGQRKLPNGSSPYVDILADADNLFKLKQAVESATGTTATSTTSAVAATSTSVSGSAVCHETKSKVRPVDYTEVPITSKILQKERSRVQLEPSPTELHYDGGRGKGGGGGGGGSFNINNFVTSPFVSATSRIGGTGAAQVHPHRNSSIIVQPLPPDEIILNDTFFGRPLAVSSPTSGSPYIHDVEALKSVDKFTAVKLKQLSEAKFKAIEDEDFVMAKEIRQVEGELKKMGSRLTELDRAKSNAAVVEDFDLALKLHEEADLLREEIEETVQRVNKLSTTAASGRLVMQRSFSHIRASFLTADSDNTSGKSGGYAPKLSPDGKKQLSYKAAAAAAVAAVNDMSGGRVAPEGLKRISSERAIKNGAVGRGKGGSGGLGGGVVCIEPPGEEGKELDDKGDGGKKLKEDDDKDEDSITNSSVDGEDDCCSCWKEM